MRLYKQILIDLNLNIYHLIHLHLQLVEELLRYFVENILNEQCPISFLQHVYEISADFERLFICGSSPLHFKGLYSARCASIGEKV